MKSALFLLIVLVIIVWSAVDIHHVNKNCSRDHGIVVKGQWLRDTGFSGYTCIEKGQH